MTFTLKEYNELRKHFAKTVKIELEREGFENSTQLEEPRKSQINFLNYIIDELDRQIATERPRNNNKQAAILYGAMTVVSETITESLSRIQRSLVRDRLNLGMGVSGSTKPDAQQYHHCFRELNNFLRVLFKGKDSRNGIDPANPLQYIPLDTLVAFMKKSYVCEERSYNAAISELAADGETPVSANAYRPEKAIQPSIVSAFTDWDTIKEEFDKLVTKELADKNKASIDLLSKARATQLGFLTSLVECLSAISPSGIKGPEKIAILAGAMHIVRTQIGKEYSKPALNHDDIAGSIIHTGLTTILHAKTDSYENIEALVTTTNRFVAFMATEAKNIRKKHPFSAIDSFSVQEALGIGQELVKDCRNQALDAAIVAHKKTLVVESAPERATSTVSSFLGGLGHMFFSAMATPKPASPKKEAVKDDEVDAAMEVSSQLATVVKALAVDEERSSVAPK